MQTGQSPGLLAGGFYPTVSSQPLRQGCAPPGGFTPIQGFPGEVKDIGKSRGATNSSTSSASPGMLPPCSSQPRGAGAAPGGAQPLPQQPRAGNRRWMSWQWKEWLQCRAELGTQPALTAAPAPVPAAEFLLPALSRQGSTDPGSLPIPAAELEPSLSPAQSPAALLDLEPR